MSWATHYIAKLSQGENVSFRPKGHSMVPKIKSGQLCFVDIIKDHSSLCVGDIVLCKVKGNQYLHLISALEENRFLISNNKGLVNGWISSDTIYGKLVRVSD